MFDAVAHADERAPTSPPCHEDQMAFECMVDARLGSPHRLGTVDHAFPIRVDALVAHPTPVPFLGFN